MRLCLWGVGLAVMMVLWGQISLQLLQKIMELLEQDLENHVHGRLDTEPIHKFASMGTMGTYAQHVERL